MWQIRQTMYTILALRSGNIILYYLTNYRLFDDDNDGKKKKPLNFFQACIALNFPL